MGRENDKFDLNDFNALNISDSNNNKIQERSFKAVFFIVREELVNSFSIKQLENMTRYEVLVHILHKILLPLNHNDNVTWNRALDNRRAGSMNQNTISNNAHTSMTYL